MPNTRREEVQELIQHKREIKDHVNRERFLELADEISTYLRDKLADTDLHYVFAIGKMFTDNPILEEDAVELGIRCNVSAWPELGYELLKAIAERVSEMMEETEDE